MRFTCCWLLAFLICGCTSRSASVDGSAAHLTHGVAAGDVSATRAVIWARCSDAAPIHVRLRAADGSLTREQQTEASPDHDMVGKVAFAGLQPGRRYSYNVWCGVAASAAQTGTFSTAAAADATTPVRFVWGGDLGGQNACRDRQQGYAIFDTIRAASPDFFVALGDMIYADDPCKDVGRYGNQQIAGPPAPALSREMFWEIWKYNRSDPAFQRLLAAMPIYPVWDDHEIMDDAGPQQDILPAAPQTHLFQAGLQAYLDFQPLLPPPTSPTRFYSSARWGKHLELFFLDLRQYRDSNRARDSAARPKTMLGEEQRRWFALGLSLEISEGPVPVLIATLATPKGRVELR